MKKLVCIILVLTFMFTLSGCDLLHSHSFSDATCTEPQKCECGETNGESLGHNWSEATCSSPKTCTACSITEGEATTHDYVDGKCKYCSKVKPTLKINSMYYLITETDIEAYSFDSAGYFSLSAFVKPEPMSPEQPHAFTYKGKKYYLIDGFGDMDYYPYKIVGEEILIYEDIESLRNQNLLEKFIITDEGNLKSIYSKYQPDDYKGYILLSKIG